MKKMAFGVGMKGYFESNYQFDILMIIGDALMHENDLEH